MSGSKFDPSQIVEDMLAALSGVLKEDIKNHVDFAERQSKALAMQAAWIAQETANRDLSDDDRDWFLKDLARQSENFAHTLAALTVLTVEKAWNAIVDVLWTAINGAVSAAIPGIKLPVPKLPSPPST